MTDFETFYETTMSGPVVGADPGHTGTGKTGREIYLDAVEFVARHHRILKSDIRPLFDVETWTKATVGTELDSRPKFTINGMLVAVLAWVPDNRGKSGRMKGHWKLQSMYMNR